ncbi:hypothetical protein [Pseudomonas sp. 25 R 14]|uniref:hypothetical protein n=1 Tax=Pseudomonas sp. 25 R 14 TaxID=1844109 RepID=UPI00081BEFCB|nr:hypothetical protein [Pseudomonas sp. 25 R 14]
MGQNLQVVALTDLVCQISDRRIDANFSVIDVGRWIARFILNVQRINPDAFGKRRVEVIDRWQTSTQGCDDECLCGSAQVAFLHR